jgi:diguanylate cyclase (GGDEF)-like protein
MGDAVLKGVAATIRSRVREVDLAGRYGGEELCVLLPGTDLAGAMVVAESLRAAIATTSHTLGEYTIAVTASIGAATTASTAPTPADLLELADAAMYRAKSAGRNRLVAGHSSARGDLPRGLNGDPGGVSPKQPLWQGQCRGGLRP